jgi:hypothetical protein
MNWVDVLFLVLLGTALLWGMERGIGSQLIGLLSLVLAGVLALYLFSDLAILLGGVLDGVSDQGRETIAFLLLLITVYNLINYAVRSSIVPPEERRRETEPMATGLEAVLVGGVHRFFLTPVYMLGSMALAFILTGIWFGLLVSVLRHSLALPWPAHDGIRSFLYHGLRGSTVVSVLDGAFQTAYASLNTLMPYESNSPLITLIRRFTRLPWML